MVQTLQENTFVSCHTFLIFEVLVGTPRDTDVTITVEVDQNCNMVLLEDQKPVQLSSFSSHLPGFCGT